MIAPKWRSGPPPSVGWWPASTTRNRHLFRWWDGERWSACAIASDLPHEVERRAGIAAGEPMRLIEWTDRPADWPERSRT